MTHGIRKITMMCLVSAIFLTTSQDAYSSHGSHANMVADTDPVCSDRPKQSAVQRMKAIQSLRETQVEVEMMKQQQAAAAQR